MSGSPVRTWAAALVGAGFLVTLAHVPHANAETSCGAEAERLRRAEAELPKLEVAPPDDKQIVCITLETNLLFARRLKAHLKQCPHSPYRRNAADWQQIETSYAARFRGRGCKPTIRGYRG